IGTRRQALDARRIAIEPAGALGERLGMRTDALDSLERSAEAHQAMPHGDGYLAGDLERGLEQQVEGPTDGSFGRILDRDHPEIGVTRLGAAKDLVDRRAVEGLDAMAEMLVRGLFGEGAARAEVGDAQAPFERPAGGDDFAVDRFDRSPWQGPFRQAAQAIEYLRLALRPIDRRLELPLDLSDLLGAHAARIEQVEHLRIDGVDPVAQLEQARVGPGRIRIGGGVRAHDPDNPSSGPGLSSRSPSGPPCSPSCSPSGSSVSTTRCTPESESPSSTEIRVTPWVARPISRISTTRVRTSTPPLVISMISSPSSTST